MSTARARNGSNRQTSCWCAPSRSITYGCYCISGIGQPYDPGTRQGTVGRNYAYQTTSGVQLFFDDKIFNPFIASGSLGQTADDFNCDGFDHGGLGFVGGAGINCIPTNGRPIQTRPVPPGTPRWGAKWKQATKQNYLRNFAFTSQGSSYAAYANHLDLDPTYKDRFGLPLLRMTFDFPDNDIRMSNYVTDKMEGIAKAMNPRQYVVARRAKPYSTVPYQSTHNTGGAIMGADPKTSVVNKYLQSWDVPNVFVVGSSAFASQLRLQSDRDRRRARLSDRRCDHLEVSKIAGPAGANMSASGLAHRLRRRFSRRFP